MKKLLYQLIRKLPGGLPRYALALSLYTTPLKIFNLLKCERDKRIRKIYPSSFPYIGIIDVTNVCNLKCPYCPTGQVLDSGRRRGMIDLETVEKFLDQIGKYLIMLHLYNWGEPILNPQLAEMVQMAHSRRIWTGISTNLNIKDKNMLQALIDTGLDYLSLSIDGATQKTYEKYRRHGDLKLVLQNIKYVTDQKRKYNRPNPLIEWQFLLFKHNQHEVEKARKLAKHLGVDIFRVKQGLAPDEEKADGAESFLTGLDNPASRLYNTYCQLLWHSVVLNIDGTVVPCCYLYNKKDDFGDLNKENLKNILNNTRFINARKLFNKKQAAGLPGHYDHPCLKCRLVLSQSHLRTYLKKDISAKKDSLLWWELTTDRIIKSDHTKDLILKRQNDGG